MAQNLLLFARVDHVRTKEDVGSRSPGNASTEDSAAKLDGRSARMSSRAVRSVGVVLAIALAVFGWVLPAHALQYVIQGSDFSGDTSNTGGDITVVIDGTGTVTITITNNLADPDGFLSDLYLNSTLVPGLVISSATCTDCTAINRDDAILTIDASGPAFNGDVNVASNEFQADGDGKFDLLFALPTSGDSRLDPGESITITLVSATTGFNADSFSGQSFTGGDNGVYSAAAHIQSLPAASGDGSTSDYIAGGVVPEPGTLVLLGSGLVALGAAVRRRIGARASEAAQLQSHA